MPKEFEPFVFVIVGASGDLTFRKLVPALYDLMARHNELRCCHLLGSARTTLSDQEFRDEIREALVKHEGSDLHGWCDSRVFYQTLGPRGDDYEALARRVAEIETSGKLPGNRAFYLALPPKVFPSAIESIGESGLSDGGGWTRIVVEKPFGHNLESAKALNDLIHRYFDESQVFRIDHYLGKETVQNLLVFRFANALFESVWHRGQIEQVEISVHESLGVGSRAGYFDEAGVLRDMIQNHLTQLLSLVAMEAPTRFDADAIRREKIKVLESIAPIDPSDVVFGQYQAGRIDGENVPAYRDEKGVSDTSTTETFAQLRLEIANWRWQGVPFILRTGKRLHERRSRIVIRFQPAPVSIFHPFEETCRVAPNILVMTLQPNEGFDLGFEVKQPRMPLRLDSQKLRFRYGEVFGDLPEAYETLLQDVLLGDQTLFVHSDEVINSWRLYTPLLNADIPILPYAAGSSGPV